MSIKEKFDKVKKSLSKNKTKIAAGVTAAWMAGTGVFAAVTNQKYQTLQEANTKITEMQERNADEVARLREELAKANMSADASLENEVGKLEAQISKQQDAINRLEENRGNLDPASQEKLDGILAKLDEISNTDDATRSDIDKVLKEVAELGKRVDAIEVKDACKDAIEAKNLLSEISTIDNLLQEHIRDNKEISHEDVFVKLTGMEEKASALKEQGLITDKEYSEIENKLSDMLDSVFVCNSIDGYHAADKEVLNGKVGQIQTVESGDASEEFLFVVDGGNSLVHVTVNEEPDGNDKYFIYQFNKIDEGKYQIDHRINFDVDSNNKTSNFSIIDYSKEEEGSHSNKFIYNLCDRMSFDEEKESFCGAGYTTREYDVQNYVWRCGRSLEDGSHELIEFEKDEKGAFAELRLSQGNGEYSASQRLLDEKESAKIIGNIDKLLREASSGQASLGQINTQEMER